MFFVIALFSKELEIKKLFDDLNISGTLVISNLSHNKLIIHNEKRAIQRFNPASTFKIPNSLIALQEKIIKNKNEIIKWDNQIREYQAWNRDQTLESAVKVSCVWCFQKFAEEIGNQKYLDYLKLIDYGNEKTGKNLSTFWLNGDLKISAVEQITFLENLYLENLPFDKEILKTVKEILVLENYKISAKTGWSNGIGWFVGFLEKSDEVYIFALNINIKNINQLKFRKELVFKTFQIKEFLN